jgi:hypothetical protein
MAGRARLSASEKGERGWAGSCPWPGQPKRKDREAWAERSWPGRNEERERESLFFYFKAFSNLFKQNQFENILNFSQNHSSQ